jgi:PAS domain S-box-containing protein
VSERSHGSIAVVGASSHARAEIEALLPPGSVSSVKPDHGTGVGVAAVLRGTVPDCAVVHVGAPEALRGLLDTDGLSLCPIVAVTDGSAGEVEREVLQAGAQEIVGRKGLSPTTLARAVERACDRWTMTRAIRDAALQQSQDLHRSLMESSADCVKVLDLDGRFLYVNTPGLCLLEVDNFELLRGKTYASFWPEGARAMVHGAVERARAGTANSFEAWAATAKGTSKYWSVSVSPVRSGQKREVIRLIAISRDITERKRAEAALRESEEALREADRRKDAFIAVLAHELRNPLAPIRAALEIQRRVGPREAGLKRTQALIERQVSQMARLVDDLMDVSRIMRGRVTLKRESCDLGSIALQTAEDYRPTLENAGLALAVVVSQGPIWTHGDPVRLAQAIGNLLQNAGRFTGAGGRVEVRARADLDVDLAVVEVIDTGIGIEPRLMPRLFERFAQAEQGLAREKGGLGLGLALTRGLVELHGGRVEVHSEGVGRGSTFRLRIPLCPPGSEAMARAVESAPRGTSTALAILLVEDNRDTAETLGELLRLNGHRVELAFDGEAAIRAAVERRPDVVISDIGLPGERDGYGVARALRANPALDGILMVALSGYADEDTRRRTREAGFDMHLAKPPDLEMLEQVLGHADRYGRSLSASL